MDTRYHVKIRFDGDRKFRFVGSNGATTTKVIHAGTWTDLDRAKRAADGLLKVASVRGRSVAAAAVVEDGRRVYTTGEATPAAPVFGPAGGYRYLDGVTPAGRPRFAIRDEAGVYGPLTEDAYEVCYREAVRAGVADPGRMLVYATMHLWVSSRVAFRQVNAAGRLVG